MNWSKALVLFLFVSGAVLLWNSARVAADPEVEPNDTPGAANALVQGDVGLGALNASDVDWWHPGPVYNGWITVNRTAAGGVELAAFDNGTAMVDRAPNGTGFMLLAVTASSNVTLRATTAQSAATYSLKWAFVANAADLWEGPSEHEPNGDSGHLDVLQVDGGPYYGRAARDFDPQDVFSFVPPPGALVTVRLTLNTTQPAAVNVTLLGTDRTFRPAGTANGSTVVEARLLTQGANPIQFRVTSAADTVDYVIMIEATRTLPMFWDGKLLLDELGQEPGIGLSLEPRQALPAPRPNYNIANGEGWFFGETMCAALGVDNTVSNVQVAAGLWMTSTDPQAESMVVSRTATVTFHPGERECFRAMAHNESGRVVGAGTPYSPAGYVTGDAARVVSYMDAHYNDDASGQVALWSVTSGTTTGGARAWGATSPEIGGAQGILNGAGVHNALNPDNSPVLYAVLGVFGALGLVGLVLWKFRKEAPPVQPLPAVAPPAPAYGYAPAAPYPQAPYGAPPMAGSGPGYGAPAYSYGAQVRCSRCGTVPTTRTAFCTSCGAPLS